MKKPNLDETFFQKVEEVKAEELKKFGYIDENGNMVETDEADEEAIEMSEEDMEEALKQLRKFLVKEPQRRVTPKIHRNEPCPCGSGKKYKKCCMDVNNNLFELLKDELKEENEKNEEKKKENATSENKQGEV